MNNIKGLTDIGFTAVGCWDLSPSGKLQLRLVKYRGCCPALYAFVSMGEVKYVGKTVQPLSNRLYGYQNPGASQRTNIRVKARILEALKGGTVTILGYHDPNPTKVGRFKLNLPAGLEDDIIKQLRPEWNGASKSTAVHKVNSQLPAIETPTVEAKPTKRFGDSRSRPGFILAVGKTYYRQGFFNVPVDFARYFAGHGKKVEIHANDLSMPIEARTNRTANTTGAPRIMGGVKLRNWFQKNLKLGAQVRVVAHNSRTIWISVCD